MQRFSMKPLILYALFILTWQSWEAKPSIIPATWTKNGECVCVCATKENHQFFDDETKALARKAELEMDKSVTNIHLYPVGKEIK